MFETHELFIFFYFNVMYFCDLNPNLLAHCKFASQIKSQECSMWHGARIGFVFASCCISILLLVLGFRVVLSNE